VSRARGHNKSALTVFSGDESASWGIPATMGKRKRTIAEPPPRIGEIAGGRAARHRATDTAPPSRGR